MVFQAIQNLERVRHVVAAIARRIRTTGGLLLWRAGRGIGVALVILPQGLSARPAGCNQNEYENCKNASDHCDLFLVPVIDSADAVVGFPERNAGRRVIERESPLDAATTYRIVDEKRLAATIEK